MRHITKAFVAEILILSFCFIFLVACAQTSDVQYSSADNWAICASETPKDVDLFIICPTVDLGAEDRFNMSLTDEDKKASFVGALNMELGIYDRECNVFAPYYRQITLSAYSVDNSYAYLNIAYQDVKAAFIYYMQNYNNERPFVLAGFSQGSQLGLMLMEDLFDESKYSDKLVAAYLIGWCVTADEIADKPWIKMAAGETDTGCIITFEAESPDTQSSFIVPAGKKTLSINPLNWKTDSTTADASLNLGACFTNYAGEIKKEVANLTGAYIDETRGTLKVPDVTAEDYPPVLDVFSAGEYHLYDYQFFYRNLQENVTKRIAAYSEK